MADAISQLLRREIRLRAGGRCEYYRIPEEFLVAGCEVDHIISRKHDGLTELSNLALSCARCNRTKGTDAGSIHPGTGQFTRLLNPRLDRWDEYFKIQDANIVGVTIVGQVTINLLRLNDIERILERILLQKAGRF